jgi:hypothetical protein
MADYMMQQPATVNPYEVLLNPPGAGYPQSYPISAYQNAGYAESVASSSTAQAPNDNYCSKCERSFDTGRDFK